MVKTFRLEELDCASCAEKMERAIEKIPEVTSARVQFLQQKLTLEAPDAEFETAVKKAQKAMRRIEPDVCIIQN